MESSTPSQHLGEHCQESLVGMGAAAPMQQKHMVSNLKLMKKRVPTVEEEVLTMLSSYDVQWRITFLASNRRIVLHIKSTKT